jgi:hypothetical protein
VKLVTQKLQTVQYEVLTADRVYLTTVDILTQNRNGVQCEKLTDSLQSLEGSS